MAATPVNAVCPIMGGTVDPSGETATYGETQIGFCCPGCKPKWDAWSEDQKAEFLASDTGHVPVTAGPVNEKCPIMGGDVDSEGEMATHDGLSVGFCCPGCKPKWEAWSPEKKSRFIANSP